MPQPSLTPYRTIQSFSVKTPLPDGIHSSYVTPRRLTVIVKLLVLTLTMIRLGARVLTVFVGL